MLQMFLTHDGEVEGGLSEAVAVPQLDGVAAAVLLLPAADGQFTAAVAALDGDVVRALLDLNQNQTGHQHTREPASCGQCKFCFLVCSEL